jgi:MFS family permease
VSRSPFLTVLALGLGALPYLLTAFIGGVLADRVDRARLLASIYCAKALVYALIWEMWATVLL